MTAPAFAIVGRIRKAHGIRGEVVVEPITDEPDAIFAAGRRVFAGTADGSLVPPPGTLRDGRDPGPRELHVRHSSPFKGGLLVAFDAIADRTEAERWRERYLLVPVEELTPPGDDEVYVHDLVGMRVEHAAGAAGEIGRVTTTFDLPQGLMLEVRTAAGRVLIPYRPEIVTRVDVDARVIYVDPPEGLLE